MSASVRRAIRAAGGRRVGVITPYVDSLNEKIRESLETTGLEVAAIHGLGDHRELHHRGASSPSGSCEFATECFAGSGAGDIDLLFASCTNFRAIDAREDIQAALGVPVVTSNHAALTVVLDQIGAPATV